MHKSMINQDFVGSVHYLRRILPKLSFGLVIATYIISALIMGIFHAQNTPHIGFKIAAFLVPLAIQIGRGTLVFFFQLNPARIQGRFSMAVIAATGLLILSLVEACLIMLPFGFSWTISVATLMILGWIIEIMILKEIQFTTQMELYLNKDQWQDLKGFYVARANMEQFILDLKAGNIPQIEIVDVTEEKPVLNADEKENDDEGQGTLLDVEQENLVPVGKSEGSLLNGRTNQETL